MYDIIQSTRDTLKGVYTADPSVSAWYAEDITIEDLDVTDMVESVTWEDQLVRSQLQVTVADPDGDLVPYRATDPLAPYGQQVSASVGISLGEESDSVPVGRYIIASSSPDSQWRLWRDRLIPTGGIVELQCQDILQDLIESEIPGLMQPKSTSPSSEIRRLCNGICPVDTSGLPSDVELLKKSVVYEQVRLNAILTILANSSAVARPSRDGVLEFFVPPTTVSKQVTVESREWVDALMTLDRDGYINTVIATSDQSDSRVQGVAQETTGPFAATGELKARVLRKSSSLYTSNAKAKAAAAKLLEASQRTRSLHVTATVPWDPTIDAADLHRLTLVPGQLTPTARVLSFTRSPFQATMSIEYSVPRSEVEQWVRSSV